MKKIFKKQQQQKGFGIQAIGPKLFLPLHYVFVN
jgi:hypothetical protein